MCWQCDHPDGTRREYLDDVRQEIAKYGWAIQGVRRQGIRPPWVYTVGLTLRGKPEVVVTGLPVGRAADLAHQVAHHFGHAAVPPLGEQVRLRGGPLIELVGVAVPTAHLDVAVELLGPGVRAVQAVHADARGHWPWDRGYRGGRGGQPVLGPRAHSPARLR
jgi:hypothetical protein